MRINFRIRAKEVRVIGADGNQLGVMETRRAIELAESLGLDLAEVSPTANPPVCKILDYGKYKYQLKKKAKAAKKNQAVMVLKEVQFRPQTDTHDVDYKVKHILRFLEEGDKVKVSVRFRGREASHADLGHALVKQIIDMVGNLGIVEQNAKMEGKVLSLVFAPNPKAKKAEKQVVQPSNVQRETQAPASSRTGST
ncbi:MAG: translation initiation factor IF-3 [Deltaproteobacteria bacterium]|nr:translation initiation factor IF-3 [Deltaproteobacteria bacterium]